MELINSWVVYIGFVIIIILIFLKFKNKSGYNEGKKVANTECIENTILYKKLIIKYKIYAFISYVSILLAIVCSFVLISRPAKVEYVNTELKNRDIFLCLDVSDSMDELNHGLCDKLKTVVKNLDGERFGITIFNAKSVLLVPLTTDYKYVLEILNNLESSFEEHIGDSEADIFNDTYDASNYNYKYAGTLSDNVSSLIGDGLASCLYNFPDLEDNKERSRIIIFTTDNELNGTPLVSVTEATTLCKKNNVKVFAIGTDYVVDEELFKRDIEKTNGKYYNTETSNLYDKLVVDIEKTNTSKLDEIESYIYDQPQIVFVLMIIFVGIYFVLSKKIKL